MKHLSLLALLLVNLVPVDGLSGPEQLAPESTGPTLSVPGGPDPEPSTLDTSSIDTSSIDTSSPETSSLDPDPAGPEPRAPILGPPPSGPVPPSRTVPELWFYYATNLGLEKNVRELEGIWRRAAQAGYTKVLLADSKFARLAHMPRRYLENVERVQRLAAELGIEIVPALFHIGHSNSMLWHDPNLAEGLPVRNALFVVRHGEAHLVADPPVSFDQRFVFSDEVLVAHGNTIIMTDPPGNARFGFSLHLPRYRSYHVSVKIRTQSFIGHPGIVVVGQGRSLQWESLGVRRTQGWNEHHVVFNTLDQEDVIVYFGSWGGARGTIAWKDWRIEEAGLVNVLRRPGTPITVQADRGRTRYREGRDYERIEDPKLAPPGGEESKLEAWHAPVPIRTRLPDGTRLRVSWYQPAIFYDGQVSACPSEPRTRELLWDEARRVRAVWRTRGYMMSHDEVRALNQDEACRSRNLGAGAILADNVRLCVQLLGGATAYVWNDMFDPFHNARKDEYLVSGDLTGSWEGIDREVVIVNWNFDERDRSLAFFANRGHRQVIAAYYDDTLEKLRAWMSSAARVRGIVGVMYTTWRGNYDHLETFARMVRE
jgi:hypothetical protein